MTSASVVVTGCGTGIGRAIIARLAADGWHTVGLEIDKTMAAEAREQLGKGHDVIAGDAADRGMLAAARKTCRGTRAAGRMGEQRRRGNYGQPP